MIEERKAEIAALEEADKKLAELAKEQGKIADKAREEEKQGKKDNAPMLAKEQADLKAPTKEVGDMIKDLAPKAAEKIKEASEKMEMAKDNFDKKDLPPAAKEGDKSKMKLEEAHNEVAKELNKKKAEEAIDQQALQPNMVDPQKAAEQVANASSRIKKPRCRR